MLQLNTIDKGRKTAIYVRISTGMQKTDRQVTELKEYSASAGIHIPDEDIFIDIISEFSRLDRKPSNLLKSIEYYQGKGVYLYFKKQNIWVKDKSDISTQIMISVLAVMSQYEIELFVARGIDGGEYWDLNNDKHVLTYDKSRRMVIVKNDSMGIGRGEYSFNDFDRMVRQKGLWTYYTTFSFCDIDDNKSKE